MRHLEKTSPAVQAAQKTGTVENFAQGYQDYLQAPLQVSSFHILLDNAPKQIKSPAPHGQPAKYDISDVWAGPCKVCSIWRGWWMWPLLLFVTYVCDRPCIGLFWNVHLRLKECKFFGITSEKIDYVLLHSVCCVAGAGRGPLVARCLKAIARSNRSAIIYAVEKNPNAFVT